MVSARELSTISTDTKDAETLVDEFAKYCENDNIVRYV
jgi:hypothetical protein